MDKTIINAIEFLVSNQQKDGSFLSLTSANPNDFKKSTKCESVFSTALILSCLNKIEGEKYFKNKKLNILKKKSVDFLLKQKSEFWSFNYWARNSKQSKEMPYPDDLDDTACALSALYEYDKSLINEEAISKIVSILTLLEEKEGGPYKTWLVTDDSVKQWKDVDTAVNCNVSYFLSLLDINLKNIEKLVDDVVDSKNYTSPYYPSIYPIIYFISRFYKGNKKKEIVNFLLKKKTKDNWGGPLNTSLAILSLLNLNVSVENVEESIKYLIGSINKDGSFKIDVFYTGINPKQNKGDTNKYYAGSSALSTAFCIEAINKFLEKSHLEELAREKNTAKTDVEGDSIYKEIVKRAKSNFSSLDDDLKKEALLILNKTVKRDKDRQIGLVSYYFYKSLNSSIKKGNEVSKDKLVELGLANLYGWIAYTIYDDFLDKEGDIKMLSVANVCMRESYRIFLNILPNEDFFDFVNSVFNRIDSANAWEVANCRFEEEKLYKVFEKIIPNFGVDIKRTADRSLGHAIGPVGILSLLGYGTTDSKESYATLEGFRYYISVRQMLDDMHDWDSDILRGQINSASAKLLSSIKNINKNKKEDNSIFLQTLQKIFWNKTSNILCKILFKHTKKSEKLFLSVGLSKDFINQILGPQYKIIQKTVEESTSTKRFMTAYIKNNK